MPIKKLSDSQLKLLRPLEEKLHKAVRQAESEQAEELVKEIQLLFGADKTHHRLLQSKLWWCETLVDTNLSKNIGYAESGLIGIRKSANPSTRLYLEASALLAVTLLRQKKIVESKKLISEVISKINNIKTDHTRHQFQKNFIARIEEECILVELIDTGKGTLDPVEIEAKAILLVQSSSDDEIIKLIGNSVPVAGIKLLNDVRTYSIKQLPQPDQKLLPPPDKAKEPQNIGNVTFTLLRRIAWKTFCKPDSPIYELWSKRIPKIFNEGYFSAAVITTLGSYNIGIPMIASGLAALAMKYTAEEFCELAKPKGIMMSNDDKKK